MVTLRLFHSGDPFRSIEARTLAEGEICVGRDASADWRLEDSACELSRRHCTIVATATGVRVRDLSVNGVFLGPDKHRLERDVETELQVDDVIHLGPYMLVIEAPQSANDRSAKTDAAPLDAPFHSPILHEPDVSASAFAVRAQWETPAPTPAPGGRLPDAELLEAFCEGAGLDPSLFAGDSPSEVLRRAGAVYRQAVLGLSDLMSERTSLKSAYRLDRTTVGSAGNNPFKWASAERVALDLLRATKGPFLSADAAINESFRDLKKHMLCLMAGSRAALAAAIDELAPERAEESAKGSLLQSRAELAWREYQKRHRSLAADARESADSAINRAFKAGYERQLRRLDDMESSQ